MKKIIYNRILNCIHKNNIINNNQYGFIPNSNTTFLIFRNIILIYKLINKNYKIYFNKYFTLNKRNDRFIIPLMKTTKYQNTVLFKGIKYYNDIIFGNILYKNNITNINKLKKF